MKMMMMVMMMVVMTNNERQCSSLALTSDPCLPPDQLTDRCQESNIIPSYDDDDDDDDDDDNDNDDDDD